MNVSNFWCVHSMFNYTQRDCTCACAVVCLYPHNFISNYVVSLTIHDNMKIFLRDVAKHMKPLWKAKGFLNRTFAKLGFWWRRTNRTIRWLVPSTVSLRRAGVEQLYQVKRMIGGIGDMFVSVQCSECHSDEISNKRR